MKTTLAKALVVKNRITGDLKKVNDKIITSNSKSISVKENDKVDVSFQYNMNDLFAERDALTEKLIAVKVAISLANKDLEQQKRVFLISELKSQKSILDSMMIVEEGTTYVSYRGDNGCYQISKSQISDIEREKLTNELQKRIDTLQDEMDKFNWNTMVELPD